MPHAPLPPAPDAVLFDAGLTLIHPSGEVLAEELAAAGHSGVGPARATTALVLAAEARHLPLPAGTDGTAKVARTFAALLGLDPDAVVPAVLSALSRPDLYRDVDPEAASTLRTLSDQGLTLGVISNSEGTVRDELHQAGLLPYLEVVVDSTVVGFEKPDPRIYRHALDRLGIDGERCWYVGDGLVNDVFGALRAGFGHGILYDRFDAYAHLPHVPRITALSELPPLVGAARGRRRTLTATSPMTTSAALRVP
ncbi:HAD family hydrolase [Streptomyces sp. NPDC059371]|uniref:HAD family hydrolase n=1 Tax=Streptomyces sp. NPDC059371 TaxID=3346812 RepID=UPI0036797C8D